MKYYGSISDDNDLVNKKYVDDNTENKADKQNTSGGFAGGEGADTFRGGAIGSGANAACGGAIGEGANSSNGGSIGEGANSSDGGAIGYFSTAGSGFSGGKGAQVIYVNNEYIDAIQLGEGCNSNEKTLQVYDKEIIAYDQEGSDTDDKWFLKDVGKLSALTTSTKTSIVNAVNSLKTAIDGTEKISNRVTVVDGNSTDDTYPTAKAVYDGDDSVVSYVTELLSEKADLVAGKVPSNQLPSYVDDVIEGIYVNETTFNVDGVPVAPESGKIYISTDTNKQYRWGGTQYVEISSGGIVLGETSSTAYRGDRGKIAYDHSQTTGNPHGLTADNLGAEKTSNKITTFEGLEFEDVDKYPTALAVRNVTDDLGDDIWALQNDKISHVQGVRGNIPVLDFEGGLLDSEKNVNNLENVVEVKGGKTFSFVYCGGIYDTFSQEVLDRSMEYDGDVYVMDENLFYESIDGVTYTTSVADLDIWILDEGSSQLLTNMHEGTRIFYADEPGSFMCFKEQWMHTSDGTTWITEDYRYGDNQWSGEPEKIYITTDDNLLWRWNETEFIELGSGGVSLGETSSTAYRGDRGKIVYDLLTDESQYIQINKDISMPETIREGIGKFTIEGKTLNISYPWAHPAVTQYLELPHTSIKITCTDASANTVSEILANNMHGCGDVHDTLTECKYVKKISNELFIRSSWVDSHGALGTLGWKFILYIPESVFGEEIPVKNNAATKANVLNPLFPVISQEALDTMTDCVRWFENKMSFTWDSELNVYVLKVVCYKGQASNPSMLLKGKWYIMYELDTPIIKYNTNKLYMATGNVIATTNVDNRSTNYFYLIDSGVASYFNEFSSTFYAPINTGGQFESFKPILHDINDLNYRVENFEAETKQIGSGNGEDDDTNALQLAIDNSISSADGKVSELVIPAGTYLISSSLIISKQFTQICGDGKVILKPTGAFPAVIIRASNVTIRDISIDLVSTTTSEIDNGYHSGIYVDNNYQLYSLIMRDIKIQGYYSYNTMDTERSYGIYFAPTENDIGFSYFNVLDNIECYSVYCGIYISTGTQPSQISFQFDRGNITGADMAKYGCAYGCICDGVTNFIRFMGQRCGAENGMIIEQNEYGENKFKNLTKAVIKCSGAYNYIEGYAYDPQRADCGYLFTSESKYNRYYSPVISNVYGNNHAHYTDIYNGENITFDVDYVIDEGTENINMHPIFEQEDAMVGHAIQTNSNAYAFSKHFGVQDDMLSYIDQWGEVSAYKIDSISLEQVPVNMTYINTMSNPVTTTDIGLIFNPTSVCSNLIWGYNTGLTFTDTPTIEDPIYIDIDFSNAGRVSFTRMGIQFNGLIASKYSIYTKATADSEYEFFMSNNENVKNHVTFHGYNTKNNTTRNCVAIRIVIKDAYTDGIFNTDKKVGISKIWMMNGYGMGNTWLPRGGGDVYGPIRINGNNVFTSDIIESNSGLEMVDGKLKIQCATNVDINERTSNTKPIVPTNFIKMLSTTVKITSLNTVPTNETVADYVGQLYINNKGEIYQCTKIVGTLYTWKKLIREDDIVETIISSSTDLEIPSAKAVYDLVESIIYTLNLEGTEKIYHKVSSINNTSTDAEYPSAKAVYDLVGDVNSALENVLTGGVE